MEAAHRVEDVRHRADRRGRRRLGLCSGRAGWPAATDDAARVQDVDQLEGAGKLGRKRDVAGTRPAASRRSASARSGARRWAIGCARRLLGREERPLEVHAEQRGARRLVRHRPASAAAVVGLAGGDERRLEGRDPVSSIAAPATASSRLASAAAKSTPPKPFTCRSTKPGHRDPPARGPASPTRDDAPSRISTSPGSSSPSTSAASTPSSHWVPSSPCAPAPSGERRRPTRAGSVPRRRRRRRAARRSRPCASPLRGLERLAAPRRDAAAAARRAARALPELRRCDATTSTIRFP